LENTCCPTKLFAPAWIRTLCSCHSCKARTKPQPILLIGSDCALSERKASLVGCPRTL